MKDLLPQGPGDQVRVSYAFVELVDRELGLGARIGRQSRGMAGVPSTFDGVLGTWQWRPDLGFGARGRDADGIDSRGPGHRPPLHQRRREFREPQPQLGQHRLRARASSTRV